MDAKTWTIIGLSLQITVMSIGLTKMAYDLGFERGQNHVLTTFDDSSDGTCLADKPPHRGPCKK